MGEYISKEEHTKIVEHKRIHIEMHLKLDELVSDYIAHTKKSLTDTSILDLMIWSYSQTLKPDE